MIITKKHYKKLQREVDNLKKELVETKRENEKLRYLSETTKKEELSKKLNEYKYAILVDKYNDVKLYNDGRFERGVMSIEFEASLGEIPTIQIYK